ncbi:MAG: cation-translocating P-type ATPase [Gammaproteobacteria bacterium]|nr:cation-translocating P-type ATPase [Gammaproteobacteria bacterium]
MYRILPFLRINNSIADNWSLNTTEIEKRKNQYGNNDIIRIHGNRWLTLLFDTISDPMIWFLIITSGLFTVLKNYNQAIILLLATIPLLGMDAFLHWRTQASARSLSRQLATTARVIRSDKEVLIATEDIVPGDLIIMSSGMLFPADGILITGSNMQVDESLLTGESFPVEKRILNDFPANAVEPAIDNQHWGFAGTRLLTGQSLMRVVYTGQETLYGEIVTSALKIKETRTPLQKAITKLVLALIVFASVFCLILAAVRYLQGFGLIDALLSAAILAIAALPDEFPVVFTFFLGIGVYRLAQKKALVKRAVSVENIGRITCICSDKTGTLTEGRFKLIDALPAIGIDKQQLLSLAMLASRSDSGDLLDQAIFAVFSKENNADYLHVANFPFTEVRKRESTIVQMQSGQFLVATKGAPETILSLSGLAPVEIAVWTDRISSLASLGYKVIACAKKNIQSTLLNDEPQFGYQFAGLLSFTDPPRSSVKEAIKLCQESGIHVLMITGDHPLTAHAIACEIGLGNNNPKMILGEEISEQLLNDNKFLCTIDVIARAIPSQKLDVVTYLQAAGEIVAVTGDGVNDVPALKAADIGISMGERGTQSAREVADIVLIDDNFDSIVNAIAEGQQLFRNLQLSFKYLLMIHIPFILSAALIPLLSFPLLYFPINVVLIELIIHPTCMLVFQGTPSSSKLSSVKRTKIIRFFSFQDWCGIIIIGLFTTGFVILSFIFTFESNQHVEHARAFSLAAMGFISAILTAGLSNLRTKTSRIITLATMGFTVLLIQNPLSAEILNLTPLNMNDWLIIIAGSLVTLGLLKWVSN